MNELQKRIKYVTVQLQELGSELEVLTNSIEFSASEIIKLIESGDNKTFSIKETEGNYEYILGGDGRSQPWSETRKGKIIELQKSRLAFVSQDSLSQVFRYLKSTRNAKDVKVVNQPNPLTPKGTK